MSTTPRRRAYDLATPGSASTALLRAFRVVLDTIDYGVLFLDEALRARMHNRAFRQMWEIPGDFLTKKPNMRDLMEYLRENGSVYNNIAPDAWKDYVQARLDAIRSGDTAPLESQRADGAVIQHQCTPLPDGGHILTYFDITEHKRAEEALRESEERFRNLIEGSIQGILIDQQRKPVFVNQSFVNMLGYESAGEILAMESMDPCVAPYERARLKGYTEARLKGEEIPVQYEYDALRKDGSVVTLQNVARFINWKGQPAIQSTVIDVTERKRVEQALRDSEERYALVTEAAEEGIYEWFIETDELYASPRLSEFFKVKSGELGPKDWHWNDRIHPDDLEHYLDTLKAHFEGHTKRWECEYRSRDQTGQYRWILDHGSTVRNEDGKAIRLVGAIRDITERKEAVEALRQSEERYALAMQAINEGVYDWNIATDEIYYSPRVYPLLGIPPEKLKTAKDWLRRIHSEDFQAYKDALIAHFKGETERFECEYRFRADDGTWRWARHHGLALRNEDGRAYRMIGSAGDITELKQREEELAEKTTILELTLESMDQGISMFDAELDVVAFNPRFLELLGFPPGRFKRGDSFQDFLRYNAEHGEYGEGDIEQQVRERLELAKRFEPHHFERTRPDGTVIEIRGKPLLGGGFLTTYTDVTERKRREQELAEQSAILEATLENMDQGISMVDTDLNVIAFNRKFLDLLGFPPDRFKRGFHMEQAFRYNAERGEYGEGDIEQQVRERLELAKRFEPHHFERTRPDGTVIEIHGNPLPGGGFVTTYTDITERKRAERTLQAVIDAVPAMINAKDAQSRYIFMNSYQAGLYGITTKEAVGKTAVELIGADYGARTEKLDQQVIASSEAIPYYEEPFSDAHGVSHTFLTTKVPLRESTGEATSVATVALDITERERAEQALREKTDFLQLNQIITAAANEAVKVADAMQIALDQICTHTGWPVGHVYMLTDDASVEVASTRLWHLDDAQRFQTFRRVTEGARWYGQGAGLVDRVLTSGKPAWIVDVIKDPNFARAKLATEIGVKGAFAFPVLVGRKVLAVLEFFSDQPAEPNEPLLEVMAQIGTQLGRVMERERAEEQLRESEGRFRAVAQSASDAIISIDNCGLVVAWNRGAESMFGYTEDEVMGTSLKTVMPEEYRQRHAAALEDISFGGEPRVIGRTMEVEGLRKDGRRFPVELSLSTWTVGGEPFYTGIIRDITERKRAEQALLDSEERYALATQAAAEGIYEWNVEKNTLYLSEPFRERLAFADDGLTPDSWNSRVHPDDFRAYRRAIIDHFKGRTGHLECEYRIRDMLGRYIWVLDRGVAVRNEAGHAVRFVGAVGNITARKRAEIELRQAKEQAESATRTKSNFLANMSHELRTPLNAIIGFTRLVRRRSRDVLPVKQYENLEKILISADHLLSLINNILDLSKIEAGRMEVHPVTVAVEPLVDLCLRTVEPLVQSEALQLVKQVKPGLPSLVADQEKLKQILMNLLSNAVKFTEKGTITVSAGRRDAELVIAVADTGTGIPEHALEQVFDEFRQVDDSRTRQHGGTGLGLSISRHLARLMGGDVTVESTLGVGSTFTVTIPLQPAEQRTSRKLIFE